MITIPEIKKLIAKYEERQQRRIRGQSGYVDCGDFITDLKALLMKPVPKEVCTIRLTRKRGGRKSMQRILEDMEDDL